MSYLGLGADIAQLDGDYRVILADSPKLHAIVYQIRYEVFCLDCGFFDGDAHSLRESDQFDERSYHLLLRDRRHGEFVGTVRLIVSSPRDPSRSFPMQAVCAQAHLTGIPLRTTAEVSRFALRRSASPQGGKAALMRRLALMQGVLAVSRALGLTHWLALMEPGLIRLLRASGLRFEPLGPMIEHHGTRQPSVASIAEALAWGRGARPDIHAALHAPRGATPPDLLSEAEDAYPQLPAWLPAGRAHHGAHPG